MPEIDVRTWNGSLATSVAREKLVPGDFVVLENFFYDSDGLPVVRGGRRVWSKESGHMRDPSDDSNAEVNVTSLFHFRSGWVGEQPKDWLIGSYAGSIWRSGKRGDFVSILDDVIKESTPHFAMFKDNLIMGSRSESQKSLYLWDGKSDQMVEIAGSPDGWIVATHADRVWAVSKSEPSKLYFSGLLAPTDWDTSGVGESGWIYVDPGDGNVISALVPGFAGEMIIFKDGPGGGSTYRLQGLVPDDFQMLPLSRTIGAMGPHTAIQVGDKEIWFASRRGVHSLQRVIEYGDLESAHIDNEVSDNYRSLSMTAKRNIIMIDDFAHDTVWMFVDTDNDGTNDAAWLFNYRRLTPRNNPSFSTVTHGTNAAAMFGDRYSGRGYLLTGNTGGWGSVYIENTGDMMDEHVNTAGDDVETSFYTWKCVLAPMDAGDSFRMKAWKELWLTYDNWGYEKATVTFWGDNREPHAQTISLTPADVPIPFFGTQSQEFRSVPGSLPASSVLHLGDGGKAITIQIDGTRGQIKLRGMRLKYDRGREDATADRWFSYRKTRTKVS
jgi:hypothetical protein